MRPVSVCISLLALSTCFVAPVRGEISDSLPTFMASFQGLNFKQRLIQKEYLLRKNRVFSLSELLEKKEKNLDIMRLLLCEEMIVLGEPIHQLGKLDLTNVVHTAGLTHLEDLLHHPMDKPFLTTKSPEYQDAFFAELTALNDISRIFNTDDWIPFHIRAGTERIKCPHQFPHQNTFYADIQKQAQTRLMAERLQQATAKQR